MSQNRKVGRIVKFQSTDVTTSVSCLSGCLEEDRRVRRVLERTLILLQKIWDLVGQTSESRGRQIAERRDSRW